MGERERERERAREERPLFPHGNPRSVACLAVSLLYSGGLLCLARASRDEMTLRSKRRACQRDSSVALIQMLIFNQKPQTDAFAKLLKCCLSRRQAI